MVLSHSWPSVWLTQHPSTPQKPFRAVWVLLGWHSPFWSLANILCRPAHPHPSVFVHAKLMSWEGYTKSLALPCCKEGWLLKDWDTGSGSWPRQGGTDRHGTSPMLRMSLCPLHSHHCLPKVKGAKSSLPAPSRAASAGGSYWNSTPSARWMYLKGIRCSSANSSSPALASLWRGKALET